MKARRASYLAALVAVGAVIAAACGGSTAIDEAARGDEHASPATAEDATEEFRDRFGSSWPDTDFAKHAVDPSELVSGGPGKDGIPAIDEPQFIPIAEATSFLDDREPVIVVEVNREARAYPVQILIWHEIVNDTVGDMPLTVTYCPLCNSAIAFERDVAGTVYDFGVSGLLRNSDLVMYDRQTESWWQQFTGEAIVGSLTGTVLDFVPASTVSFADFRAAHPAGMVLSRDTGFARAYGTNPYVGYDETTNPFLFEGEADSRLPPAERVVAVELDGETVAYPFSALEERLVVEDTVGGTPIVVLFQPGTASALDASSIADSRDVGASGVFLPETDGRTLTFRAEDGEILDDETGSTWDILGRAVDGPLEGTQLAPVIHGDHFWFAWAAFKPQTRNWTP
ncbi:MAG: DUF3179 domain-containing protein [Dehalococcoidia bacterium]